MAHPYVTVQLPLLTAIFVVSALAVGHAEDWPAWTGPFGQNRAAETRLVAAFDRSDGVNVNWAVRLGTVAFGAPTIADGRVFIGTNYAAVRDDTRFRKSRGGVLTCLDEATGDVLWHLVSPERTLGFPEYSHMIQQRWGICSSPTVDGNRVYVVTNGDDVLCLDVNGLADGNDGPFVDEAQFMANEGEDHVVLTDSDADIIWRYDIPRELDVAPHDVGSCTVLVHRDVLYTSTSNGLGKKNPVDPLRPDAPAFIALDKHTGALLAVENEGLSERLYHAQWSSPSHGRVNGRDLIFLGGGDGYCYAFGALIGRERGASAYLLPQTTVTEEPSNVPPLKLRTVWKYDCNPPHFKRRDGKPIYFYQGDERVYKGRKDLGQSTAGLSNGDGTFAAPCQVLATPILYNDRAYVAIGRDPTHGLGRGALHCIDATLDGDITQRGRIWSYEGIGRTLASVAIDNGLVYAVDLNGTLHCLDADTGDLQWKHTTDEETWGSPLVADGKVYLNTKESFWILKAGRELDVLFNQRGGSECGPVAANGVVYAFIRGRLYAFAPDDIQQ